MVAELGRLRLSPRGPGYEWRMIERSIAGLGPACAEVERRLRSPELLDWARAIVGERELVLSPQVCGGLFRDGHGQELEPHLDMNCTLPRRRRRATLILYVHPRWRPEWGGRLELFSGPSEAPSRSLLPEPNRVVLMESNDRAWHGVSAIELPPAARALGRRALILNFYAPGRSPRHLNVWMPRPAPARVKAGAPLGPRDRAALRRLYERRIERLRELRALELAAAPRARQAPVPELPEALLSRGAGPSAARRARAVLGALDRELLRLYRLEYAYRSRLGRRSS